MNAATYSKFLDDNFMPYYNALPQNTKKKIVFMHDNAPSHAAHLTIEHLADKGFRGKRLMQWPPQSPDLNPIENYWAAIKMILYANGKQYKNNDELWTALLDSFRKVDRNLAERLTKSVDNRLVKLFERKGKYINY